MRGMVVRVVLARLFGVMRGVNIVAMSDVGVVSRLLMVSAGVLLRCRAVMFCSLFVMLRCFQMVVFAFFGHIDSLSEIFTFSR